MGDTFSSESEAAGEYKSQSPLRLGQKEKGLAYLREALKLYCDLNHNFFSG